MKKATSRIAVILLCILLLSPTVNAARLLIPGGQVIGLELQDNSVTVAAFDDVLGLDAQAAGLQVGDKIQKINSRSIHTSDDVRQALQHSDGTVKIDVCRNGRTKHLTLTPAITDDGPRLGVYLKQGITGVGTVTWYDPESGAFGALGHGVNTQDGQLVQMQKGSVYPAEVLSVKKGTCGAPGQLMGSLDRSAPIGTLTKNTAQGVFGAVQTSWTGEALPIGSADQIKAGPAVIRSTVQGNEIREYSVEILKIYPVSRGCGRNLLLHITDPALLNTTGGIVQGMSGSPIIQDGKLVGAVTHVLVNDPTTGYGIFIENMLDAAA